MLSGSAKTAAAAASGLILLLAAIVYKLGVVSCLIHDRICSYCIFFLKRHWLVRPYSRGCKWTAGIRKVFKMAQWDFHCSSRFCAQDCKLAPLSSGRVFIFGCDLCLFWLALGAEGAGVRRWQRGMCSHHVRMHTHTHTLQAGMCCCHCGGAAQFSACSPHW